MTHTDAAPFLRYLSLGFVGLLMLGTGLHFFDSNNDLWWHLKTGELILEEKAIPDEDPYSFTKHGEPWVAHEWLSELLFYSFAAVLGFGALVWLKTLLFLLTMVMLWHIIKDDGFPLIGSSILVVVSLMVGFHLLLRPHLFFWLFLLLTITLLKRKTNPLWLIPIFIIWANTHASVFFGVFIVGIYAGARFLKTRSWRTLMPYLSVPVAALLNPVGAMIYLFPFQLLGESKDFVTEWQPFPLIDARMLVLMAMSLLLLYLIIKTKGVRLVDLIPLLVMLPLAFMARRNIPLAVFLLAIPLAERLSFLLGRIPEKKLTWLRGYPLPLTLIFLMVVAGIGVFMTMEGKAYSPEFPIRSYAFNAMGFIKDNNIGPNIFNDYEHGGVAIFMGYPDIRVFIDGRIDMYGKEIMIEYYVLREQLAGWESVLDRYGIDGYLLSHGSPLEDHLLQDPTHKLVYFDGFVSVIVPQVQRYDGLPGFVMLGPYDISMPRSEEEARSLAGEMEYLLEMDPGNAEMHKNLGMLLLATGLDVPNGKDHLGQYLELEPKGAFADEVRSALDS